MLGRLALGRKASPDSAGGTCPLIVTGVLRSSSAALPFGLAFRGECRHALGLVLGVEEQVEAPALELEARPQATAPRRDSPRPWPPSRRPAASRRSCPASSSAAGTVDSDGTTVVTSPWASASRAPMFRPGQDQLHRPGLADRPREPLRAARPRHHTELDLWLPELGVLAGDDHVAQHRQLAATAQREPADGRDDRLPDPLEPLPAVEGVVDASGSWGSARRARGCPRRPRTPDPPPRSARSLGTPDRDRAPRGRPSAPRSARSRGRSGPWAGRARRARRHRPGRRRSAPAG